MIVLKPSKIEGVGCFTTEPIKKGSRPVLFDIEDEKFILKTRKHKPMFDHYCVETTKGWWCPLSFTRMSVGWYLNHSDEPNISTPLFKALRDIESGEELTIDYKLLDKDVDNSI